MNRACGRVARVRACAGIVGLRSRLVSEKGNFQDSTTGSNSNWRHIHDERGRYIATMLRNVAEMEPLKVLAVRRRRKQSPLYRRYVSRSTKQQRFDTLMRYRVDWDTLCFLLSRKYMAKLSVDPLPKLAFDASTESLH